MVLSRQKALAFFQHEAAGGLVLMAAAAFALLLANSPASGLYERLLDTPVSVQIGALKLDKPLLLWINDGLMAIFFLLVGLEIKREMMVGALSSFEQAALPAIAAIGGMAVPALIYALFNWHHPHTIHGWAIPAATDIAFAIGVLALVGPRVPSSLKVFLLALAIMDDLGAIVIIALFYTENLALGALGLACVGGLLLFVLNRRGVTRIAPYILVGVFMWVCVLKSGVHATLAGVATALAIPLHGPRREGDPAAENDHDASGPLERLEHELHSWVTFGILPLFAFSNAGVSLAGVTLAKLAGSVPMGIIAGLALGKPIGIVGATWVAVRRGFAPLPEGATWKQLVGIGCLGGIGFTMSLFIGMLAFTGPEHAVDLRIGVLAGSLISALVGSAILTRNG